MESNNKEESHEGDCIDFVPAVYKAIALNQWPGLYGHRTFGIVSKAHYDALRYAVRNGVSVEQFVSAQEDGKKITALIGADNPFHGIVFQTLRDEVKRHMELANANSDPRFGICPECSKNDGSLNIGWSHWFKCDTHQYKWKTGEDLFFTWHYEEEDVWMENRKKLDAYREVVPVLPLSE